MVLQCPALFISLLVPHWTFQNLPTLTIPLKFLCLHLETMYSGGCIFLDHATGDIDVKPLVNFTKTETLEAKQ